MKVAASSHSDIGVWSGIKEERSCELDVEFKNVQIKKNQNVVAEKI